MTIDIAIKKGILNSRSLIADSRLNYEKPWKYKHLTEKEIFYYKEMISTKIS